MRFILCCAICLCLAALVPNKRETFSAPGVRDLGGARLHYVASESRALETARVHPAKPVNMAVEGKYIVYCPGIADQVAEWCEAERPDGGHYPQRRILVFVQHGVSEWQALRYWNEGMCWRVFVSGETPEAIRGELVKALRALDTPRRTYPGNYWE